MNALPEIWLELAFYDEPLHWLSWHDGRPVLVWLADRKATGVPMRIERRYLVAPLDEAEVGPILRGEALCRPFLLRPGVRAVVVTHVRGCSEEQVTWRDPLPDELSEHRLPTADCTVTLDDDFTEADVARFLRREKAPPVHC